MVPSYPQHFWNISVVSQWLQEELQHRELGSLAEALGMSTDIVQAWAAGISTDITYEQVLSIAQYRRWFIREVRDWLGITPHHWHIIRAPRPLVWGLV